MLKWWVHYIFLFYTDITGSIVSKLPIKSCSIEMLRLIHIGDRQFYIVDSVVSVIPLGHYLPPFDQPGVLKKNGGAYRDRTCDLNAASVALSQLS